MGTLTLTGFAAYLLLWAAVLSGIAVAAPRHGGVRRGGGRAGGWRGTGGALLRYGARRHEALALAAFALGTLHGVEAVSGRFGGLWWLVVTRSGAAIQFGVAALLLAAVVVSAFYLRRRFPGRAWRRLHLLAYPAFGLALWHAVAAGANAWLPAVRLLYLVTAGSVAAAGAVRMASLLRGAGAERRPRPERA